jgi:hypothetical protein
MPKHTVRISTVDPAGDEPNTWPWPDEENVVGAPDWHMAGVVVLGQAVLEAVDNGVLEPGAKIWAVIIESDGKEHVMPGSIPQAAELESLRVTYAEAEEEALAGLGEGKPVIAWPRRDRGTGR